MADAVETPENRTGEPIAPQQEEAAPADPWAEEGQIEAEAPEALWEDEVSTPPQDTAVEATPEQGDDGSKLTPTEAPTGDDGSKVTPTEAPTGDDGSKVTPTEAPTGDDGSKVTPTEAPTGMTAPEELGQDSPSQDKDEVPGSKPEHVTINMDQVPTQDAPQQPSDSNQKGEANRSNSFPAETLVYDRLGVQPTATDSEIRSSYKRLALQLHPDKGGDPDKFKLMKEAYEVLSNHQKRTVYDLHGMEGIKCMEQAAQMETHMSDYTGILLVMMEVSQSNALMRSIFVMVVMILGSYVASPFILLTLKWDGDTAFSWAVPFIPCWISQVGILCCQQVFLGMQSAPPHDEEDPEAAMAYRKFKKEINFFRLQSFVTHLLSLSFQILLILRLEAVFTASWIIVICPWLALEVWSLLLRIYFAPVAWVMADPQGATEAANQAKRSPRFWLFLIGNLQLGFFRLLTFILVAARADAGAYENAVSWWLVFLPLYISLVLWVALPCLERRVRKRRSLLSEEEENQGSSIAAKGCGAIVWLIMIFLAAGKLEVGGAYSAAWVFSPIFFTVSLAVCLLCLVIIFAQPQHFQRAAESMGEPIGKPAAETE